jgi:ankyrin repeat protein
MSVTMKVVVILFSIIFFQLNLFSDDSASKMLTAAVAAGNAKAAEDALKNGADPNHVDEDWPLFITAVTSGDKNLVKLFIRFSVNTEITGPDKKTALMHALSMHDKKTVDMLITAGANLKAEDSEGKTIFMYAAENDFDKLLQSMLDKGFDRNKRSRKGKTALDYAIKARVKRTFRLLSRLETMPRDFVDAVEKGDRNKVKKLIRSGAQPDMKDPNGKPVILTAIEKGHDDIVTILLKNGLNPNAKFFKNKKLTLFVYAMHNGKYKCALEILKSGGTADFNHRYKGGKTALMLAIEQKNAALINLLVRKNFDPDRTDQFGNTALMYAAERNMYSVADKILQKGGDPTIRQVDGKTAAEIADKKGNTRVKNLLKKAEKKFL